MERMSKRYAHRYVQFIINKEAKVSKKAIAYA